MGDKKLKQRLPGLWRISRYFWPQVRKHRGLIAVSLTALFAEVGLRLLEPWPLKFVFDRIIEGKRGPENRILPGLAQLDTTTLLAVAAIALVCISGLRALADYWNTIGFAQIGNRVLSEIRRKLYRHVQYLSLSFHTKSRTGDVVMRIISDVGLLQDVAVTAMLPMLAKVLIVISMVGLMSYLHWKLTLAALVVLPFFWFRTVTLSRRIRAVAQKQRKRQGAMAAKAVESISGIKTVQALSLEETFARGFSDHSEQMLKDDVKGQRLAASLMRSVDVLVAISTALVLWYGTRLVLRNEITPGDLLVFLAYLRYAYRPLQDFSKYTGRLAKASAAGERVIELLNRVPEVYDLPGAQRAPEFAGNVAFENVSFEYESRQPVLDQMNLEVKSGQHVLLIGPSGSGKSTLVSLILRLYDPKQGRVLMDGRDVREFTLESLRGQIAIVLQDNLLFAASVRDNIAQGVPQATMDQIEAAARLANANEFIEHLPQGYSTMIGERGVTLSHGQRQRIAIARAAIRKTPVLILDEPTSGLDKSNEATVMSALERLYHGRTTFLISHDLRWGPQADLILLLENGKVVEHGGHEELLRAGTRYAALYRAQAGELEKIHQSSSLAL